MDKNDKKILESLASKNTFAIVAAAILFISGLLGLIIISLFIIFYSAEWSILWAYPINPENLAYQIPFVFSILMTLIGGFSLLSYVSKRNKLYKLFNNGTKKKATIVSSQQNFAKKMNKTPERIVKFKTEDGEIFTFKSYDYGLVPQLKESSVMPIIFNNKGDVIPDPSHFKEDSSTSVNVESFGLNFAKKTAATGDQHFKQKNYQGAIMAYQMALEKYEEPQIVEKLAKTFEQLDQQDQANQVRNGNYNP